jgi:ribonucleoside-triphosphate reductase
MKEETARDKGLCGMECEVFSRVVGYYRPVQNWNIGKQQEFKERKAYDVAKALKHTKRK